MATPAAVGPRGGKCAGYAVVTAQSLARLRLADTCNPKDFQGIDGLTVVPVPIPARAPARHSRPSIGATHTISVVMRITQTTLMIAPGRSISVIR
jgi:hypothetical protein